jgi:Ca2+-binding EF-hand superfamily protein
MSRIDMKYCHCDRPFAGIYKVLSVVTLIVILAANPAQAQRAKSSAASRAHSTAAQDAVKPTNATAQAQIRQLLLLMDKDKNGAVSKDEFMEYMSQTFDRVDVNKNSQLEHDNLSNARFPFGKGTSAAATNVVQLLRLMDKDKNDAVSKDEFMEYMSQTFDRLDVNKSGQLERNELRRMADPNWMICHDLRIC